MNIRHFFVYFLSIICSALIAQEIDHPTLCPFKWQPSSTHHYTLKPHTISRDGHYLLAQTIDPSTSKTSKVSCLKRINIHDTTCSTYEGSYSNYWLSSDGEYVLTYSSGTFDSWNKAWESPTCGTVHIFKNQALHNTIKLSSEQYIVMLNHYLIVHHDCPLTLFVTDAPTLRNKKEINFLDIFTQNEQDYDYCQTGACVALFHTLNTFIYCISKQHDHHRHLSNGTKRYYLVDATQQSIIKAWNSNALSNDSIIVHDHEKNPLIAYYHQHTKRITISNPYTAQPTELPIKATLTAENALPLCFVPDQPYIITYPPQKNALACWNWQTGQMVFCIKTAAWSAACALNSSLLLQINDSLHSSGLLWHLDFATVKKYAAQACGMHKSKALDNTDEHNE